VVYPSLKPSDRISRKQVTIYVTEEMHARIRTKAVKEGIPIQEIIAKAINAGLAAKGTQPVLNPLRLRVFIRKNGAAGKRKSPKPSRNGKYALSGWYDRKEVESLANACIAHNTNAQELSESGMKTWLLETQASHSLEQ